MADIDIRVTGHAGRITLNRPKALNALTYDMLRAIEAALEAWRNDDTVKLVIIDALGDRAFCAGGDIQDLYDTGRAGDFAFGQTFWRDEYRLNARIAEYPKPYIAFMQGFTMGGGVGVSCHGSDRIVGESSQIAMPECGIGLVPDVGGSELLAAAPGRLGDYFGVTAARMSAWDAIYCGFADHYVPELKWPDLIAALENDDDISVITKFAAPVEEAPIRANESEINQLFAAETLIEIEVALQKSSSEFAAQTLKAIRRNSPLSAAVAIEMLRRLRRDGGIRAALHLEYRYTFRAMEHGDFLEGIRAQIIDKDRNPSWRHAAISDVTSENITFMLSPLGDDSLNLKEQLS